MPAFSDYLLNAAQNVGLPGVYVGLVNNVTSVAYKTGPTTATGLYSFTISPPEPGLYTVYNSPTGAGLPPGGDWVGTGETNYVVAPAGPDMGLRSLTLSPATPYQANAPAGYVSGKLRDWGGGFWNALAAQNPNTANPIQGALDAANAAGGGKVYAEAGLYSPPAALKYYGGIVLEGAGGGGVTKLITQVLFTGADWVMKPNDATVQTDAFFCRDMVFSGFGGAGNLGGIQIKKARYCSFERVVSVPGGGANTPAFAIIGAGTAADTFLNSFTDCFASLNVSGQIGFLNQADGTGVSAAEATEFVICKVSGAFGNTAFRIDKNGSALAADSIRIIGGNFEGCGVMINSDGYSMIVSGARFEVTSGNMTGAILNPISNAFPGAKFMGNVWAVPGTFTWTDNGAVKSPRIGEDVTGIFTKNLFTTPISVATGAAAPTSSTLGANVTSVTMTGNDQIGKIVIVMAGALAANTKIGTITFNRSYGATSPFIRLTNETSGAGLASVDPYVQAQATGVSFDIAANQALAAGTYTFGYLAVGAA